VCVCVCVYVCVYVCVCAVVRIHHTLNTIFLACARFLQSLKQTHTLSHAHMYTTNCSAFLSGHYPYQAGYSTDTQTDTHTDTQTHRQRHEDTHNINTEKIYMLMSVDVHLRHFKILRARKHARIHTYKLIAHLQGKALSICIKIHIYAQQQRHRHRHSHRHTQTRYGHKYIRMLINFHLHKECMKHKSE